MVILDKIINELKEESNIYDVWLDGDIISVKPVQNKSFFSFTEVFENFLSDFGEIVICNEVLEIVGWDHYNTNIYRIDICIKEDC